MVRHGEEKTSREKGTKLHYDHMTTGVITFRPVTKTLFIVMFLICRLNGLETNKKNIGRNLAVVYKKKEGLMSCRNKRSLLMN